MVETGRFQRYGSAGFNLYSPPPREVLRLVRRLVHPAAGFGRRGDPPGVGFQNNKMGQIQLDDGCQLLLDLELRLPVTVTSSGYTRRKLVA